MPAAIKVYTDAACTTELALDGANYKIDFGVMHGDSGETKQIRLWLKNIGDQVLELLDLTEIANAATDADEMTEYALDNAGVPGTWQAASLSFGNVAAGAVVSFWARSVVLVNTGNVGNPRIATFRLRGFSI